MTNPDSVPINLNRVRKARDKAADKARADVNAVRHGQTKAAQVAAAANADSTRRRLDQLKFDE